ncbi:hypothetical protein ABPG74_020119 [Tetrahymena malaccensis]
MKQIVLSIIILSLTLSLVFAQANNFLGQKEDSQNERSLQSSNPEQRVPAQQDRNNQSLKSDILKKAQNVNLNQQSYGENDSQPNPLKGQQKPQHQQSQQGQKNP